MPRKPEQDRWGPATRLILEHVGRGRQFQSQAALREEAGIGSPALRKLKSNPRDLNDSVILKLCLTVGVDPDAFYSAAGKAKPPLKEFERLIEVEEHERTASSKNFRLLPVEESFKDMLLECKRHQGMLLSSILHNELLAPQDSTLTDITIKLIEAGACIALHVPTIVDASGRLKGRTAVAKHYFDVFQKTKTYVEFIYKEYARRNSNPCSIHEKIALFTLRPTTSTDVYSSLIPHEERTAFLVFPQSSTGGPSRRWVFITWSSRNLSHDHRGVAVSHEPIYSLTSREAPRLKLVKECFRHLRPTWQSQERFSLDHRFQPARWKRVVLSV